MPELSCPLIVKSCIEFPGCGSWLLCLQPWSFEPVQYQIVTFFCIDRILSVYLHQHADTARTDEVNLI